MSRCQPLRMIVDNQLHEFDLTATPQGVPTLPVGNILDEQRSYVFRSQTIAGTADFVQVISGTHRQERTKTADGLAIAQTNFNGVHDTFRLVLKRKGAVNYDSGDIRFATLIPLGIWQYGINYLGEPYDPAGLDNIKVIWFPKTYYDEFQLYLTKRHFEHPYQTVIPYIDVGHVFLGLSISPKYNFSWGNSLLWDHGQTLTQTEGGSLITEGGHEPRRELTLDLEYLTDNDRNRFSVPLRRTAGQPVLVAAYPEAKQRIRETEYTLVGKLRPRDDWQHTAFNQHAHQLNFREI